MGSAMSACDLDVLDSATHTSNAEVGASRPADGEAATPTPRLGVGVWDPSPDNSVSYCADAEVSLRGQVRQASV